MKDQRQKDRQSLANSQYRSFMKMLLCYLGDPIFKDWAHKESETGSPDFIGQIDPSDSRVSGFGVHYTRPIHDRLVLSFNLVFQAGLREMCKTEVICSYALAENPREIYDNPGKVACYPIDEEDVLEKNDPYIWQVWNAAEKLQVNGLRSIRKSELTCRGSRGMHEMAECAAALVNPMITIAIGVKNVINEKKD